MAAAKGSSEQKAAGYAGGAITDSQPSPDTSTDGGEQVDINSDGVQAAIVATMAAIAAPAIPATMAAIAVESGKGSDSASEAQATATEAVSGVTGATTTVVQLGSNQHIERLPGVANSSTTDQATDAEKQNSAALNKATDGGEQNSPGLDQVAAAGKQNAGSLDSNLARNRIAGGSVTTAAPEDGIPVDAEIGVQAGQPSNETSLQFTGTEGDLRHQTSSARSVAPAPTGDSGLEKPDAGTEGVQTSTRFGATMSTGATSQGSPDRGASLKDGTPVQATGGPNVTTERGAVTQATDPVTKPANAQETDSVSIGATNGMATARDVPVVNPSRGTDATLNQKGDVLNQILDRAATMSVPRNSSMRVQLRPPELGWVDLRLGMKDGILTLHITTESANTKGLIEMALPQLRQALQARDIQVGDLSLALNSGAGNLPGWLGNGTPSFDTQGQWAGLWRRASSVASQVMENTEPPDFGGERTETSSGRYLVDYRI